jgi:Domain of unknown function (DUF5065)
MHSIISKKASNLFLVGAITFGCIGFSGETSLSTNKVHAATTNVTDWNGYKEWNLINTIDMSLAESDLNYKYGHTYNVNMSVEWRKTPLHIKIYRVNADGTLQRYKTMNPVFTGGDGTIYNYNFNTTITTAYPAGNYYAVHTYSYEYAGENGPVFTTEADRSYRFTIN